MEIVDALQSLVDYVGNLSLFETAILLLHLSKLIAARS
jgi:hypothetical protein